MRDVLEAAPLEAALAVEAALDGGAGRGDAGEWRETLLAMYRAWASARNMQVSEARRAKEAPILLIGGFGAYRTLAHEAGLHVLEMPEEDRSLDRVTARVRVAAAPFGEIPQAKLARHARRRALAKPALERHGAPLPQRRFAAGARHGGGLAHGSARRGAARRFRPHRRPRKGEERSPPVKGGVAWYPNTATRFLQN